MCSGFTSQAPPSRYFKCCLFSTCCISLLRMKAMSVPAQTSKIIVASHWILCQRLLEQMTILANYSGECRRRHCRSKWQSFPTIVENASNINACPKIIAATEYTYFFEEKQRPTTPWLATTLMLCIRQRRLHGVRLKNWVGRRVKATSMPA